MNIDEPYFMCHTFLLAGSMGGFQARTIFFTSLKAIAATSPRAVIWENVREITHGDSWMQLQGALEGVDG